ncbi:MAG: hypothetical protein Q7K26_06245 [bacterium]|nr:hypothetical protein [bacterium]
MIKLTIATALAAMASLVSFAVYGQDLSNALSRSVGVEISYDFKTFSGGGVWLGNGEVLSASHIFMDAKSLTDPIFVVTHGKKYKATPIFHGNPPHNDLILLKIDAALVPDFLTKAPAPQVCDEFEPVGAQLYVTAREVIYNTYASPYGAVTYKGKTWATSTTAMLSHGVSGSPVYDTETSCLAGIVSLGEWRPIGNVADPKRLECEIATLQLRDSGDGITCAAETKSVFMTADVIRVFLKAAKEYQRTH